MIFFSILLNITKVDSQQKADDKEIMVIGTSKVIDGNMADARNNAISDALLKSVEDYLTLYLGSQMMISNFPRLINEVIPNSGDEIENFHILAEDNTGKQYKILVRVKINESLMEEKLREIGIIMMEDLPLKILLLISQKIDREGEVQYWWNDPESNSPLTSTELILFRVLQERGFNPVNRLLSIPDGEYSTDMRNLELTNEGAIEWGRIFSSDVAILGKSEILGDEMVFLNLKVFDIINGTLIGQDIRVEPIDYDDYQDTGTEERYLDTLEKATNRLITQLSPVIINSFKVVEEEINLFEIEVRGLKNFEQLRVFNDFIEGEIIGVKSILPRKIKRNSITLLIEFSGDKDSFLRKVKENPHFPLTAGISSVEEGGVVFEIR
jgi:hypothetical protein